MNYLVKLTTGASKVLSGRALSLLTHSDFKDIEEVQPSLIDEPEGVTAGLLPQAAKVSKISYGRTYNTGSYTNTRLDVTVDVPTNEKAADILKQLEQVFTEADPNNSKEGYEVIEARRLLLTPLELAGGIDSNKIAGAKITIQDFERRKKRMETARNLLDHLGAQSVFKDGRWTWEDKDEEIPF